MDARRINVVGSSGSGKTTFARRLAELKGVPYIEMDALYWRPQWREPSDAEFLPQVAEAVAGEAWVLDGSYSRTRHIKWPRTEALVFLDLPKAVTVSRVLRRALRRIRSGEELWPGTGNRETVANVFLSRDSIVLWAAKMHGANRQRYADPAYVGAYPHLAFIRLTSPGAVDACLAAVAALQAGTPLSERR